MSLWSVGQTKGRNVNQHIPTMSAEGDITSCLKKKKNFHHTIWDGGFTGQHKADEGNDVEDDSPERRPLGNAVTSAIPFNLFQFGFFSIDT